MKGYNRTYTGLGVSPGVAIGRAYHVERSRVKVFYEYLIDDKQLPLEVRRLEQGVAMAEEELKAIRLRIPPEFRDRAYIIDSHLMILRDPMIYGAAIRHIERDKINAEWALKKALDASKEAFSKVQDEYISSRIADVEYVVERVLRLLSGKKEDRIADISERAVVIAHDLSPADTTQMQVDRVIGFVTEVGGRTSHTAIIARSLEIPAVLGLEDACQRIPSGELVIVDGTTGTVVANPDPETLSLYEARQREYEEYQAQVVRCAYLPAETQDGYRLRVNANIEMLEEVTSVLDHGGEGIGLYRTEFLYLNSKELPTEEVLYENFRDVAHIVAPRQVTIRTLDIGGDKFSSHIKMPEEMNPAMGLRAIRFCLKEPEIFRKQLRAILRASAHGSLRILFPMISSLEEIRQARQMLEECARELAREGKPFDPHLPVGIMIEVPSTVAIADVLAREVDFFSIGTNDLIQYTLAIDRVNEQVAHLYEPLHPAILRMIRTVVQAGHERGIPVAMCGEMAGEPLYVPVLLGLELDELSMNAQSIPKVKRVVRTATIAECRELSAELLKFSTIKEIKDFIFHEVGRRFPEEVVLAQAGAASLPSIREGRA